MVVAYINWSVSGIKVRRGHRKVTFDRVRDEPPGRVLMPREALGLRRPTATGAATDDGSRGWFVLLGAMARRETEDQQEQGIARMRTREMRSRETGSYY